MKDLVIDSTGECDILIRPWDLYTSSATGTNNCSFYNETGGLHTTTAFEYVIAHPMKGFDGGYGSNDGRYTQYRIVSTVLTIKYAGQVTDYAGMYTGALMPGYGDDIDTLDMKPSLSQMNQLPYSYNTPIKSSSDHKLCFLPIDGLDMVFTKPEPGSDDDSSSTRGQLFVRLTDCSEHAKFQVVVDSVVEYIPCGGFE